MMVNGRIINIMEGLIIMKMEKNIQVILRMIKNMVMEFYIMIIIKKNIRVNGKMVKNIGEQNIIKMVRNIVCLIMVNLQVNLMRMVNLWKEG